MFKLAQTATYKWPVVFNAPADGGKFEKHTFELEFKRISQSKIDEIVKKGDSDEAAPASEFMKELIVGWKGILHEDGSEIEFSPSALEKLFDIPGVVLAVWKAYLASLSGAKAKN